MKTHQTHSNQLFHQPPQQYGWSAFPVPADAGDGMTWKLQPQSDEFNYEAPAHNKGATFLSKWSEIYQTMPENGEFRIIASRELGSDKTLIGASTPTQRLSILFLWKQEQKL